MIKTLGLTHIHVAVRDLERAQRFYHEVFGATELFREDPLVFLNTPGSDDVITLHGGGEHPGESGASSTSDSASRTQPISTRQWQRSNVRAGFWWSVGITGLVHLTPSSPTRMATRSSSGTSASRRMLEAKRASRATTR